MLANHHYNKNLKPFARKHRNDSTNAEIRLWREVLRNKQLFGYPFLQQRPIGNYIADFFCKELKLIIEVDGLSHQFEEIVNADQKRENDLIGMGYNIIRFNDDEVMNDLPNVLRTLQFWIEAFQEKISIILVAGLSNKN